MCQLRTLLLLFPVQKEKKKKRNVHVQVEQFTPSISITSRVACRMCQMTQLDVDDCVLSENDFFGSQAGRQAGRVKSPFCRL